MKTRTVLIPITLLCAAMVSVQSARAAIITVTNINDSGLGSLRQAVVNANDGDTIDFDSSLKGQTITLTSGQLLVNRNVTISGLGADNLTVDGNANGNVFYVNLGNTVTISGLTITNGSSGIYNDGGALTLSDCTVSGNSGGGIGNRATHSGSGATMTVSNCTVSDNSGRGIGNVGVFGGSATMTVTNSTISGNSGGGIGNSGAVRGRATLTVTNSTISGNSDGGIANFDAILTITNSTLSGNSAGWGGGISSGSDQGGAAIVTVSNSTISGNSADYGGGGIYNAPTCCGGSRVIVNNSTISGNSAVDGGGIYNSNNGGGAALELGSAILKAGTLGENIFNAGGTVTSYGYNLSSDNGGGYLTGPGDQINTDPMLGPLQDNGGPTFTYALLPGSPAIDTGDPKFTPPPSYDQRGLGFDRVVNGRIDVGSFEVQGPTPTATPCDHTWIERSPVPYNAGGMFATSDGTYVYTGAGGDINAGHNELLRYDPKNNSWIQLAPSPDEHALSQAVYFKGKLYNMGGFLGNLSQVSNTTRIYDISTDTWTTGKPMPTPLGAPATMLWEGIIYVAGGYNGESVDTLYAYNIATDTWSTLAPMPQRLYAPGFGAINGKLYIASGYDFGTIFNTLQIYDIATNTWTISEANVPTGVGYCGSTAFNGLLYLYGGVVQSGPSILTNITQIYDPVSDTWCRGPNMNVTRWWVYGTAVGNHSIVAPGGVNANIIGLDDNEQLSGATPTPTPTATPTVTQTPSPTATPTATARPSPTQRPRPTPAPRP